MSGSWWRRQFGTPRSEIVQAIKEYENNRTQEHKQKVLDLIQGINPDDDFCKTKFLDTYTKKTLIDYAIQTMDVEIASKAIDTFIVISDGKPMSKGCRIAGENNLIKSAFDRLMDHINVTNSSIEESFDEYEKLQGQEKTFRKAICAKYNITIPYSKGGARKTRNRNRNRKSRKTRY